MLPAEIGRTDALTREPDTAHTVVGKDVKEIPQRFPGTVSHAEFFFRRSKDEKSASFTQGAL